MHIYIQARNADDTAPQMQGEVWRHKKVLVRRDCTKQGSRFQPNILRAVAGLTTFLFKIRLSGCLEWSQWSQPEDMQLKYDIAKEYADHIRLVTADRDLENYLSVTCLQILFEVLNALANG